MTMVLGDPCVANVFVPVTLSPPRRRAGTASTPCLSPRRRDGAEVAVLDGGALAACSAASGRPVTGEPRYVSLGRRCRKEPSDWGTGDPYGTLLWYSESGLHSGMPPVSLQRASYVNHSQNFDVAKPAKTYRDFELQESAKRAMSSSTAFTATSTQRSSFSDLSQHKDLYFKKPAAPKKSYFIPPMEERAESTTSGGLHGFSAGDMAAARGSPTFTADHKCVEAFKGPRPATIGRNVPYFTAQ